MTRLLEDVMKIGKNDGTITQLKLNKFDIIQTIDKIINEIKFVEKINHIYKIKSDYASLFVYLDEKLIMRLFVVLFITLQNIRRKILISL